MRTNQELTKKVKFLLKELKDLKISFKRSENIRSKQNEVIKQLKKEIQKSKGKSRAKSAQSKLNRKEKNKAK